MSNLFQTPLALFNLGPWEVILVALVALLLFGHRLPEVARSAGKAVVEFKKGLRDVETDADKAAKDEKKNEEKKA